MPILAIDLVAAARLGERLGAWAVDVDAVAADLDAACAQAELCSGASHALAEMAETFARLRRMLLEAVDRANAFELPPIEGLAPTTRWNDVHQLASHNTYQRSGGLQQAHRDGFRSFELDLHVGAPTDFRTEGLADSPPWIEIGSVLADAITADGAVPGDWHVFHHSADPRSAYRSLSSALDELAALSLQGAPLTVFLDLKDPLAGEHSGEQLDVLLRDRLGDRLYTPADVLARSPAASIGEAVAIDGWPTIGELDGRVLIVLTAEVDAYRSRSPLDAAAFVAVEPTLANLAAPDVVFFNQRGDRLSAGALEVIEARSAIVRSWGAPTAPGVAANYVAID